jgi:hypothetical protein
MPEIIETELHGDSIKRYGKIFLLYFGVIFGSLISLLSIGYFWYGVAWILTYYVFGFGGNGFIRTDEISDTGLFIGWAGYVATVAGILITVAQTEIFKKLIK